MRPPSLQIELRDIHLVKQRPRAQNELREAHFAVRVRIAVFKKARDGGGGVSLARRGGERLRLARPENTPLYLFSHISEKYLGVS